MSKTYYLTVTGNGSWMAGAEKMEDGRYSYLRYGPGVHEVSEEIAEKAKAARRRGDSKLVVTEYEPEITTQAEREAAGQGGLQPTDFHKSTPVMEGMKHRRKPTRGVQMKARQRATTPAEAGERTVLAMEFPCPECEESFPTKAPLEYHMDLVHEVAEELDHDTAPEPVAEPEIGVGLPVPDDAR